MSDDLRRRLRMLEEDYARQPLVVQEEDLPEINRIRAELGMPLVDARLKEIAVEAPPVREEAKKLEARDHTEARRIYEAYLARVEELEAHRAYAKLVARATAGAGQTPVHPLATMGTDGGPLLCDYCMKPIVLEGGQYHGVPADVAWARHPSPTESWTSWILGGLVVELVVNGTLRIYHGYPGRNDRACCNAVSQREKSARAAYEAAKTPPPRDLLLAFLDDEFPALSKTDRQDMLKKIVDVMYGYDPGFGVNRPRPPKAKGEPRT